MDLVAIEPAWVHAVTRRDRRILSLAALHLGRSREDFDESLRALVDAVEGSIPQGRIYLLDRARPLIGSLVSRVGIAESPSGVIVERIDSAGRRVVLGRLR